MMKRNIVLTFVLALFSMTGFAQLDRSIRPEPGPARQPSIAEYKSFELDNGIKVFVVQNKKLPRVSFSLSLDRDPIFEGEKAGYVQMAGDMLRNGTTNRTKSQIDEEIDFMGANLSTFSTGVYASSLSKYAEDLFEIAADVVLNPSFPQDEFDKLKNQYESGLESAKDNPDAIMRNVFGSRIYGLNHPYGEMMTEASLEKVSIEDCKAYYETYFRPNIAYITVVGDIKPKAVKKLLKKYFSKWESKELPTVAYGEPMQAPGVEIAFVNRDASVQSVIKIGNVIDLKPGAADIEALRVANQILGGGSMARLFKNLREDKAYTYGAYSSFKSDPFVGSFAASASVRNEVTDSAVAEFLFEINRMRTEMVSDEELQAAKNNLSGGFGRSLESPNTVASFATNIAKYDLPKDYYNNYLSRLNSVTKEDVLRVAKKYMSTENIVIGIVGKGSEVAPTLERFGPVSYFTYEGIPTTAPSLPLPEGVTAMGVLDTYFEAVGGKKNLEKVKSISVEAEIEIPGAPAKISQTRLQKTPSYLKEVTSMGGMALSSKVYANGKGQQEQRGQKVDAEGEQLEQLKEEAAFIFSELKYVSAPYSLKMDHIAIIQNEKAYVVDAYKGDELATTLFFSVETGLLIQEDMTEETPQGPMVISTVYEAYEDQGNIKMPTKFTQKFGPQSFKIEIVKVDINPRLGASDFK